MSKSKPKAKKPPRCQGSVPDGSCCPAPAFPGHAFCAQHIRESEPIRTFQSDWRVTNPKLHNYYVRGAYEDLQLVESAARALEERSRVPCDAMAGVLRQAMREEIESSAAFFEAAALLFAGLEPPKED